MFTQIQDYPDHLKALATTFLNGLDQCEPTLDTLKEKNSHDLVSDEAFGELESALARVRKLMRFVGSVCCIDEIDGTSDFKFNPKEDMMWLVSYKGKEDLESGLAEIVLSNTAWQEITDEVVRTATTSMALRPERDRALETLNGMGDSKLFSVSAERLSELIQLTPRLKSGMRQAEVSTFMTKFLSAINESVEDLLSGEKSVKAIGSKFVHLLMSAANCFTHVPGTTTTIDKLRVWMTKHNQDIAWSDLAELAKRGSIGGGITTQEVADVLSKLQKQKPPPELLFDVKTLLAVSFHTFVKEAAAMCSSSLFLNPESKSSC